VLDAGSGSGYGSAYLAKHGAKSVEACDASSEAVEFSKRRYANSGVNYQTLDLCGELPYANHSFDVIFSSNVMEHLIEIDHFIDECRRIIRPGGKFLIAVPPIPSKELLTVNIKNEFHVTNLTPRGWYSKISRFFENVACHQHRPGGRFEREAEYRERDFIFPETSLDDMNTQADNMTAIFVATMPRETPLPYDPAQEIPYDWRYGAIVASVIAEERAIKRAFQAHAEHLQRELDKTDLLKSQFTHANAEVARLTSDADCLRQELTALKTSPSWRVTAPVRAVGKAFKF
jgi:SAM-dependent methyltransferase